MEVEIKETEICECECHQDKSNTRHVMSCCGVSGKYITTTGEIDMVRWAQCYRATKDRQR